MTWGMHFDIFVKSESDAFVFTGAKGAQLRRSTFQRHWRQGLAAAGLTGRIHFHDLRPPGNTWAAEAGATLRELMDRMGHACTRAALTTSTRAMTATRASPRPCQN